jgi:HlyD family secretion protein
VDVGQTVAASLQAPVIFTIANDLAKMQIDANVAEADVGGVEIDQDVEFTVDAFPSRTFQGKVVQVRNAPITVQNVVTYDTVIGVSNPELKLKPGMTANVSIVSAHRDDALKIPNGALRFRLPNESATPAAKRDPSTGGGRQTAGKQPTRGERRPERSVYVLAPGDSKPARVTIKTGISDGVATEIVEGLKEGDRVVTGVTESGAAPTPATNPFGGGQRRR